MSMDRLDRMERDLRDLHGRVAYLEGRLKEADIQYAKKVNKPKEEPKHEDGI